MTATMTQASAKGCFAICYRPTSELKPRENNARTHSKRQIQEIAKSIESFGFTNPILIDKDGRIIAGHGRHRAAESLGLLEVPTVSLDCLTEDQIRAYVIADNRLAEKAGWDKDILAIELQYLLTIEDTFDVTVTGFEVAEIDLILEEAATQSNPEEDLVLEPLGQPVSRLGDLWNLGKHQVLCGDSLKEASYTTLMGRKRADLVFTDPPYNVQIHGHATGNGATHHREFAMASGELSEAEYIVFLEKSSNQMSKFSHAEAVHFIFMDWRHIKEITSVGQNIYDSLLNLCVWVKHSGGMGSLYRSQHELIFVYRNGKGRNRNNIQLSRFGRNRTNIWNNAGATSFAKSGEDGNLIQIHPTVKPIQLIVDALLIVPLEAI